MNEVNKIEYERHLNLFVKEVCSICGICKNPIAPETCKLFWESGNDVFLNSIVVKAQYIKYYYKEKFDRLNTFEGFTTLFCNAGVCPMYNAQCIGDIGIPISCYKYFLIQSNVVLTDIEEGQIYRFYAGKSIITIKTNFGLPIDFPKTAVLMMKKKKRKKLLKTVKKANLNLNALIESSVFYQPGRDNTYSPSGYNMSVSRKKGRRGSIKNIPIIKKEPTTLFFYNEDGGWPDQVDKYLTK